jgi:hypothetical protein
MSLGEVTLGILRLFLLIGPFGRLENLICETLESVAILGLVLSLGVKNADAIQEAFKFIWPRPVLLMVSWPFHHSVSEVALGILGLFLLIGPFGRLENLICETLESVAIPGLVLSLGVKM